MAKKKSFRPKARVPKGLPDQGPVDIALRNRMIEAVRAVFELHGFDAFETPTIEYADALGKFLPDQDRPNEGVFSFQDDDEQWLSLRYDHTAPLARYVAQNFDALPKPFRRYQVGPLWRNEKPGPGRFREFYQIDADTVGTPTMAADAELIGILCDSMEAVGISPEDYRVRVNNRKVLTGVLQTIGVDTGETPEAEIQRLTILRAVDKLDRLGREGVEFLLGKGRRDDSGDFTEGAGLTEDQIQIVMGFTEAGGGSRNDVCVRLRDLVGSNEVGLEGVRELEEISEFLDVAGYADSKAVVDPSVVRGLGYYTGPVFEADVNFDVFDAAGQKIQFGSVAAGGRYDDLIKRFKGVEVPATGASIGISRLMAVLQARDAATALAPKGPVVVLVLDQDRAGDYQRMVQELRAAGVRAELYLGGSGMRAQMKYADKRGAQVTVIQGSDEHERGEVTLKDLALGAEMSKEIKDNEAWREGQPAQIAVPRSELVSKVKEILSRHSAGE